VIPALELLTLYMITYQTFKKNDYYSKYFKQLNELGIESFGSVFKAKREVNNYSRRRRVEYSAINKIEFTSVDKNAIIREYLKYKIITRNYSKNEYLVKFFDAWLEESFSNQSGICLYIQIELCDMTLDEAIKEFTKDSTLKTRIFDIGGMLLNKGTLTTVGYYIASNIFLQILEGVNHLHKQDPPLIHGALTPSNILLKKSEEGLYVKIADFGLIALHQYSGQWHTIDKGTLQYMAPEVFSNKKYDIKADIYSLGVIFKDLTDFEPESKNIFKDLFCLKEIIFKYISDHMKTNFHSF
jgi:serine/threonine protein kinase